MNKVIVIGGGAAGLMAADVLSAAGVAVHLYDAMPSVGRMSKAQMTAFIDQQLA